jgi:hypothetical protein
VPSELVGTISSRKWENQLKKLWEYRQDQEDISLVESEMRKTQKGISLKDYIKKCHQ